MDRGTVDAVAECRDQVVVEVEIDGAPHYLTVDQEDMPCDVERLAQCFGGDAWELWSDGKLLVFDKDGRRLFSDRFSRWKGKQPIRFFTRPKNAKFVCGRCGLTMHQWRFGWKHASGGKAGRKCCDKPVPVQVKAV